MHASIQTDSNSKPTPEEIATSKYFSAVSYAHEIYIHSAALKNIKDFQASRNDDSETIELYEAINDSLHRTRDVFSNEIEVFFKDIPLFDKQLRTYTSRFRGHMSSTIDDLELAISAIDSNNPLSRDRLEIFKDNTQSFYITTADLLSFATRRDGKPGIPCFSTCYKYFGRVETELNQANKRAQDKLKVLKEKYKKITDYAIYYSQMNEINRQLREAGEGINRHALSAGLFSGATIVAVALIFVPPLTAPASVAAIINGVFAIGHGGLAFKDLVVYFIASKDKLKTIEKYPQFYNLSNIDSWVFANDLVAERLIKASRSLNDFGNDILKYTERAREICLEMFEYFKDLGFEIDWGLGKNEPKHYPFDKSDREKFVDWRDRIKTLKNFNEIVRLFPDGKSPLGGLLSGETRSLESLIQEYFPNGLPPSGVGA